MVLFLRLFIPAIFAVALLSGQAVANEKNFRLFAPQPLIDSGVLKFILPRFSLKTQVRIAVVSDPAEAEVRLGDTGRPVFEGLGQTWHLALRAADHPGGKRFADWLMSEIGQRTVTAYELDGVALFSLPHKAGTAQVDDRIEGDAVAGRDRSRVLCGRCHVVMASNRMKAIGSTPSFFALRSLRDWQDRFAAFFALNPHPAFTQVTDITDPFPSDRPSPIVPITLTLDDLEAIMAYVAGLEPANLGAPLQHQ